MNFDAAAIALLLFASPGVLFFLALSVSSRVRVLATREWLLLLASVVIPSLALHFSAAWLLDRLVSDHTWQILPLVFRGSETSSGKTEAELTMLAQELGVSCLIGIVAGTILAKAIVWRWINTAILHGPSYPFFSGFRRRFVRVSVLSNVQEAGRYVIYDGFVADLALTSDGRLAWISLLYPSRTLLEICPSNVPGESSTRISNHIQSFMDDRHPGGEDGSSFDVSDDILTLEGEDVLNYYMVALAVHADEGVKGWVFDAWSDGRLPKVLALAILCTLIAAALMI